MPDDDFDVRRLRLAPGDLIVISTNEHLSYQQREAITTYMARVCADAGHSNKVLVLEGGLRMDVLSARAADALDGLQVVTEVADIRESEHGHLGPLMAPVRRYVVGKDFEPIEATTFADLVEADDHDFHCEGCGRGMEGDEPYCQVHEGGWLGACCAPSHEDLARQMIETTLEDVHGEQEDLELRHALGQSWLNQIADGTMDGKAKAVSGRLVEPSDRPTVIDPELNNAR